MLCLIQKSRPEGDLWVVLSLISYMKESMVCPEFVSLCSDHAVYLAFQSEAQTTLGLCIASFALLVFSCQLEF